MLKIKQNFPLKNLSTFKIGGTAKYFCTVKDDTGLSEALLATKRLKVPYKIIAGGSNIAFPDNQLNCLLIKIDNTTLYVHKNKITADAGVPLAKVIDIAIQNGLRGLETLSGIPGTVGGALVGNAGAYGHSISEVVEIVEVYPVRSRARAQARSEGPFGRAASNGMAWLSNTDCQFKYRDSVFRYKPYIILRAVLKFKKGNPAELKKISREIIKVRLKKYKPGLRCPGSFFKNVLVNKISKKSLALIDRNKIIDGKIPAGYLLEEIGAKGMQAGRVEIADFHGNLFINKGNAKARHVKKLAKVLKERVKKKFHISLEEEVRYF